MRPHAIALSLAAVLLLAAGPVLALSEPPADAAPPPMLPDSGLQSFPAARDRILADLDARDVYVHIRESERREVLKALERMDALLAGANDLADLTPEQRTALLNDQERVNTLLTQAWEQGQLICKRDRTVGTRFKATQCKARHEWDMERETAQMSIKRIQRLEPRGSSRGGGM